MPQLHAAYCIPEILAALAPTDQSIARSLLRSLAHFELDSHRPWPARDGEKTALDSLVAVAKNLVSRGIPTRAPLTTSQSVVHAAWPAEASMLDDERRGISFQLGAVPPEFSRMLVRALHITEPRLSMQAFSEATQLRYPLDSQAEHRFLNRIVAARFGPGLAQALLPQVPLDLLLNMVFKESGESAPMLARADIKDSLSQFVDFALPLPYPAPDAPMGLILEVDGPHHQQRAQKLKDNARVEAAKLAHWHTDRLSVEFLDAPHEWLINLSRQCETHPYCRTLQENWKEPLHASNEGRRAEQLLLSPILAARVHRALLEAVDANILDWEQPVWNIDIVEHDVPGGRLGVEAFSEQMTHLFALEGAGRTMPSIQLRIFSTSAYRDCELNEGQDVHPMAQYSPDTMAHLVLDVAVLSRPHLVAPVPCASQVTRLVIRSSGLPLAPRRIAMAPLVRYADVSQPDASDEYLHHPVPAIADALRFFLRDIFRKSDFRPGQLPILKRGLKAQSVLGLLPTGGGKSLTYQLAALLQPGISLVVDPIKSLMQDQYEGLLAEWIDASSFLNSSVFSSSQRRLECLEGGEVIFFFISPERMQTQSFRDLLVNMTEKSSGRAGFGFCVIDEAHCVSEWGHDFRTQYLRLGATVRRFCRTYDRQQTPIYGLTATASFDVLADVQRELALPDQDAIVRTRTTRRRELRFRVLQTPEHNKHGRIKDIIRRVPSEIAQWSDEATRLVQVETASTSEKTIDFSQNHARPPKPLPDGYQPTSFYALNSEGHFPYAGLIFCPHKSAKVKTGVESVLALVNTMPQIEAGKFTAGNAEFGAPAAAQESNEMMQTQRDFIENRLNMMVATKAFGMGIDKPNVRFTIHYCHPASIESLVQEAGRAGRDGAVALNYILFNTGDANISNAFFKRSFKGRRKEALMLHELLTSVSLPASSQIDHLRETLQDEFSNIPISPLASGLWPKENPHTLYVNQGFQKSYGSIDLRRNDFPFSLEKCHESIDDALAWKVLNRVSAWLRESVPAQDRTSPGTIVRWLSEEAASTRLPGILPTIANAPDDEEHPTLVIGFKNGESNRIKQALNGQISESMVWKAAGFASEGEEFLKNLQKEFKLAKDQELALTEEQTSFVCTRFDYLRDEQDTYKAVYRLTLLGLVADYTVNYGAKAITLYLNRKPADDTTYTDEFVRYISRYTTLTKAQDLARKAALREKGQTHLEKLLGELLDFTYGEIADKRQNATREMVLACEKGIAEPDEDLGEFFDLYFNSKYARAQYLPTGTQGGTCFSRDVLWQYMGYITNPPDGIGKERDNVKHLRGACARMLSAGADKNGAVLLLDAFALLFLEFERQQPSDTILAAACEKLLLGFQYFQQQEALDDDAIMEFFEEYAAQAESIEKDVGHRLRSEMRDMLLMDIQKRWLKAFNDRFDNRLARTAKTEPELLPA